MKATPEVPSPRDLEHLRRRIRDVPDFPKVGILFRDITPLLADPACLRLAVNALAERARGFRPDIVAGIEARGFILGASVAVALGCGFIPIRKQGKLPHRTRRTSYALEYGMGILEMHEDVVGTGQRVLLVDDVLATGGTLSGACRLVLEAGGTIGACAVLVELAGLQGRARLPGVRVTSLLVYE